MGYRGTGGALVRHHTGAVHGVRSLANVFLAVAHLSKVIIVISALNYDCNCSSVRC